MKFSEPSNSKVTISSCCVLDRKDKNLNGKIFTCQPLCIAIRIKTLCFLIKINISIRVTFFIITFVVLQFCANRYQISVWWIFCVRLGRQQLVSWRILRLLLRGRCKVCDVSIIMFSFHFHSWFSGGWCSIEEFNICVQSDGLNLRRWHPTRQK